MTGVFERIVEITPAYDHRVDGHGIHGCDLIMNLKGKTGVVYFSLSTNWFLPGVTKDLKKDTIKRRETMGEIDLDVRFLPSPIELGYHSPVPLQEEQEHTRLDCHWFPGKTPCYCDSSCLNAAPVFDILLKEGSEGVWKYLEEYYKEKFANIEGDL